jgi:hypothetical protein
MERSCDVTRSRQAARRFAKPDAVPSFERNNAADGRPGTLLRRRRFWVVVGVERLGRNTATPGGGVRRGEHGRTPDLEDLFIQRRDGGALDRAASFIDNHAGGS